MTKSEIFNSAHKIARNTVKFVGNYMIAFSLALKEVYKMTVKTMKQKLLDAGMSVWGEDFGKARIYINAEQMESVFGLEIVRYNTGNISIAKLNGAKISNSEARRLTSNKIYFDVNANEFVGTDLQPII